MRSARQGPSAAELTEEKLSCMTMSVGNDKRVRRKPSKNVTNGTDKLRIQKVLKYGACKCKRRCSKQFDLARIVTLCGLFWGVHKAAQDSLIWSLCHGNVGENDTESNSEEHGGKRRQRRTWKIDDRIVCRKAFQKIMGLSSQRIQRVSKTHLGLDTRLIKGRANPRYHKTNNRVTTIPGSRGPRKGKEYEMGVS